MDILSELSSAARAQVPQQTAVLTPAVFGVDTGERSLSFVYVIAEAMHARQDDLTTPNRAISD